MAKIERWQSEQDGQFYWHMRDDNGEIVCHGEGHPKKENVPRAVNNIANEFIALAQKAHNTGLGFGISVEDV